LNDMTLNRSLLDEQSGSYRTPDLAPRMANAEVHIIIIGAQEDVVGGMSILSVRMGIRARGVRELKARFKLSVLIRS
jgi:hypothetical protein